MIHPLVEDLDSIEDAALEEKILDLTKKYFTAYRLGKPELLTQLEILVNMYRQERTRRNIERTKKELGGDLDQLINVD